MIEVKQYAEETTHPGKFEGEPAFVPYFWDQIMEGDGEGHMFYATDEDGNEDYSESIAEFTEFVVDVEEAEAFDLEHGSYIVLWEDSQGFVLHQVFTKREEMFDFFNAYLGLGT